MRTTLLIILLLLALTACAGKEDAPMDPAATNATAAETDNAQPDAAAEESSIVDAIQIGPVGAIQLQDGTVVELTEFKKLGKYYIYITGKLNGRSSTVISLTRLDDVKQWRGIAFQDQHTFTIFTVDGKEFHFTDSRVYLGNDTADTYTFMTTVPGTYETTPTTVKKKDVKAIKFSQPETAE